MKTLFRTKSLGPIKSAFHPVLNGLDLTLLGIGAIIGAGVFVLTGTAAVKAGPGIALSYIFAGLAALFSALSYAELATSIGGSGSAYNYTYSAFGEFAAWLIGWALILEYTMSVSTVAIGWSGYVNNALQAIGFPLPDSLTNSPLSGGIINLPAFLIIILLTFLLCNGVKQSARFNAIIVAIKLVTIGIFIIIAAFNINPNNWAVFLPEGMNGVAAGAALVFFAYIGFDALSTAAEETINPQRNLPIGIIASLIICTVIYVIVALLLTGIAHYSTLNVSSPVAFALLTIHYDKAASVIAVGAIAGLTTVMLVMFYGLTRILYAISRDGLLPLFFSRINVKTNSPVRVIIVMGLIIALLAGFVPLQDIAELVNIGTLTAFIFVCLGVIMLRIRKPNLSRPFKLPFFPVVPILGILFCAYLILNLMPATWSRFGTWMGLGILIYFGYSQKRSLLREIK